MSTLTAPDVRQPAIRRFAAAHPIAAFLATTFLVAYPSMLLVALAVRGVVPGAGLLSRLPIPPDEVAGLLLTLGGLLPSALCVTWAADGRQGVRQLFRRVIQWRFGWGWWLVILTGVPLLTVTSGLLLGDSLREVDLVRFVPAQVSLLLVNLLVVNLWEEAAWAGVVQTRLARRHNVWVAALLTAVPFAVVHWPLALFDPNATAGSVLTALPGYLVLGALVRPLLGLTLRATRNSILSVALLHSLINRSQNSNGIGAGLLDGDGYRLGLLIGLLVLTGAQALVLRGKLGREGSHQLDDGPGRPSLASLRSMTSTTSPR